MDFFGRQARVRRLSRWLVLLFTIAILAIVVAIDTVLLWVAWIHSGDEYGWLPDFTDWVAANPGAIFLCSLIVLAVIGGAALFKGAELGRGGGAVAQALGGTRVTGDTTDPLRRRLLNVVEEMAIASAVPVPEVYVMEREPGINAFAAGHNPANAAVAVTRGALTHLDRSELQGVIAHEFGHILNGDMRLSTRLIGWLFGLMVVALIARFILRHVPRSSGKRGAAGLAVVMMAAAAVLALGYIGLFFGRLIQAAVSRGRESLADASAVQFTREPTGIRNALVKIGALGSGSLMLEAESETVAHLLFAAGTRRMFATHPRLEDRIRAIDPSFRPEEFGAMRRRLDAERAAAQAEAERQQAEGQADASARLQSLLGQAVVLAPGMVAQLVGNPGTTEVHAAQQIRVALPGAIRQAAAQPEAAAALFVALALDRDPDTRGRQLAFIGQQLDEAAAARIGELLESVDRLSAVQRMPALLGLLPAMHQLGRDERARLLALVNGLLTREGRPSVYAYALRKLAQVQLRDELQTAARPENLSLGSVATELQALLVVLARNGHADPAEAQRAYAAGVGHLLGEEAPPWDTVANWPRALDAALNRLDRLAPEAKERLVEALVITISHDLRMTVEEFELLRTICAVLHCPLPPQLGQ